ncbi:MAG: heparin lyase I family protein [Dongiaceae bacterium]
MGRVIVWTFTILLGCALLRPAVAEDPAPSPKHLELASDFNGDLGAGLTDAWQCQGKFEFRHVPAPDDAQNMALAITLNPNSPPGSGGSCKYLRGEVGEASKQWIPQQTEIWYSLRFMFPKEMRGKIGTKRFVLTQLKQSDTSCALSGGGEFDIKALKDGNPILSIRPIENSDATVAGVLMAASSVNVGKIPFGLIMQESDIFFGNWHSLLLHVYVDPRVEGNESPAIRGYLDGSLDGEPFAPTPYGLGSDGKPNPYDPFGYPTLTGCTYLKFGIYGDPDKEPWTVIVDRFRRGATKDDVK